MRDDQSSSYVPSKSISIARDGSDMQSASWGLKLEQATMFSLAHYCILYQLPFALPIPITFSYPHPRTLSL